MLLLLLLRNASDLRNCTSYFGACMWVRYCRPPVGAHFHPTPQPLPVPQQLGEKDGSPLVARRVCAAVGDRRGASVQRSGTGAVCAATGALGGRGSPLRGAARLCSGRRPARRVCTAVGDWRGAARRVCAATGASVQRPATAVRRSHSTCTTYSVSHKLSIIPPCGSVTTVRVQE